MTGHEGRKQVVVLLDESITAGARQAPACEVLGLSGRPNAGRPVALSMLADDRYVIIGRPTS
jgi:hypothetical protein